MSKFIVWCRDNPWIALSALLLVSAFFAYHARNVRVEASTEGMILKHDPDRPAYDRAVETFGSDNFTCVYVKDRDLFTHEKLTAAADVFYKLQDIPGVLRVDGLFNATNFKGEGGTLTTNPFLDPVPEDPAELVRLKADALRNPLLTGTLISPDGTGLAITVTALSGSDEPNFNVRLADDIDRAIAPLRGKVDQVFQVGEPMTKRFLGERTQTDQRTMGVLCFIVLLTTLIIGLRTVNGAILPTLTGGLSILWTTGFGGHGHPDQLPDGDRPRAAADPRVDRGYVHDL